MTAVQARDGTLWSLLVQVDTDDGPRLVEGHSLRVVLADSEGHVAEVQVAYNRGRLVVIAAGEAMLDTTPRGFARLVVAPE